MAIDNKYVICDSKNPTLDDLIVAVDRGLFDTEEKAYNYMVKEGMDVNTVYIAKLGYTPVAKYKVQTTTSKERVNVKI